VPGHHRLARSVACCGNYLNRSQLQPVRPCRRFPLHCGARSL
jgi:hypothetical protein